MTRNITAMMPTATPTTIPLQSRMTYPLLRDWLFTYIPEGQDVGDFTTLDYPDTHWRPIALPHTWHTYETTGHHHPFTRDPSELDDPFWWTGHGLYRKHLHISDTLADRKVFLEFEGVQTRCRVFVNGLECGGHVGGFCSFYVDITQAVRFGQANIIAVEVDARRDHPSNTPPMTAGNWNIYGGIYRQVHLVFKHPLYIPFQGSADHEGGVFITTPNVSHKSADVRVRGWVCNEYEHACSFQLRHRLFTPQGHECQRFSQSAHAAPGQIVEIDQRSEPITAPALWSPDSPAVYHCRTELYCNGMLVDELTSPFGFRWFHWDYQHRQLYLNDQPIHLHGTNRHQEYPWLGDAVPHWIHQQELREIRHDLGHNFIRTCHYPQSPAIYDECDRLGLICCEEVPNIKNLPFAPDIQARMVREMVRRDRNHPSIIMWSVGNETDHAADGDWVRELDPTRIVHARHVYAGTAIDEPHNHEQIDMENLLRCTVRGWPDGERFPEDNPNGQVTGTERWQHESACIEDASIRGRIDRNTVVWIYADHGADREYQHCPLKHVNPKGWVDMYRVPKYIYHLWRAHYADDLAVFIHPHQWNAQHIGQKIDLTVDSNADHVELFLDDRLLGTQRPTADSFFSVTFKNVHVVPGTLKAVAHRDGQQAVHQLPMPGKPTRIRLRTSHPRLPADRSGIALLRVDALDEAGHVVPDANPDLSWSVQGPGRLLAPLHFQSQIDAREADEGTMYITLPIRIPLRCTNQTGTIRVQCDAPGLEPGIIEIEAIAPTAPPCDHIEEPTFDDSERDMLQAFHNRPRANGYGHRPLAYEDLHLDDADEPYHMQIDRIIRMRLPSIKATHPNYQPMLDELAQIAQRGHGTLVADDFNNIIERFQREIRRQHQKSQQ